MGADIHGWVETRTPDSDAWDASFDISPSVGCDRWDASFYIFRPVSRVYGMFASLFGVRNGGEELTENGRFRAIAPGRGAPPSASASYVLDREGSGAVGETWVLWSELADVDWEEEGAEVILEKPPRGWEYAEPGAGWRHERRGDYLVGGWENLIQTMAMLAEQYGAENVRLAVWFDQW